MGRKARSLQGRLEHRLARLLVGLPPRAQQRLCGGAPCVRDGLTLHPELQMLLSLRAIRRAPALSGPSPQDARDRFRREALAHAGERIEVGGVQDLLLDVGHSLAARHYAPLPTSSPRPLLVFLHGGGFVLGDLDTHDSFCRLLCRHADVHVLAVDYRLAPEHPYPAAVEDTCAALRWARERAAELGAGGSRLAVGGDSAGGNLAAVAAHRCAREGEPLALQLLLYPAIDRSVVRPSLELFDEGFMLTRADIEQFERWYLADGGEKDDPGHAPLSALDHSGLPPALVVTAGFDPLRDEGEAYAEKLRAAGNSVVLRRFEGFVHGFVNLVGVSRACREAVIELAGSVRAMIDADDSAPSSKPASASQRSA